MATNNGERYGALVDMRVPLATVVYGLTLAEDLEDTSAAC